MCEKMRGTRQISKVFMFAKFCLLGTNAVLGAHWSCVKRCAEDGKCVLNGGVHINKVGTHQYITFILIRK